MTGMRQLDWRAPGFDAHIDQLLADCEALDPELTQVVQSILRDVRTRDGR